MDIRFEGVAELARALNAIAANVEDHAGEIFADRVRLEVEARPRDLGKRPLDLTVDGLEVTIGWPYGYRGGDGTYVGQTADAVGKLMIGPLARDLSVLLEP